MKGILDLETGLIEVEQELTKPIGTVLQATSGYYVIWDSNHLMFLSRDFESLKRFTIRLEKDESS